MNNLLQLRDVSLGYDKANAVSSLDLDVQDGAIVALLGSNGAGKTTTLRGISGLLKARTGSIRFGACELTRMPAYRIARLGIRHVPEGRQIFGDMTVLENLSVGAMGIPRTLETDRRDEVLSRFPRLKERLSQRAGQMSGGEQQMLALGRALMSDPRLLLLDEPSMGLAPLIVSDIFKVISALKRERRTILLVEQNARAALKIADFAYVLESGRIAISGSAEEIAGNPKVAAAYLGEARRIGPSEAPSGGWLSDV